MSGALDGRSALVTGGGQGLGLAIAAAYLREGARVVICGRSQDTLDAAQRELDGRGELHARVADVSAPADAEAIVAHAVDVLGDLQVLVNNAGVYGPKGAIDAVDWEQWAQAVQVNLFGSVLPARAALGALRTAPGRGKIVQISGGGATAPLPFLSAYAASKAGVVRFAETLAGEEAGAVDVNAIAPGALNTRMLDEVLEAGPDKVGAAFYAKARQQRDSGGTPLDRGADLAVYLGSAASDGITGRLLSAVWDPWETLHDHAAELEGTDVYTLRRIVPAERGMGWGERG